METVSVSSRIEKTVSDKLTFLSKATSRSRSFLINEAVKAYVEQQAWQIEAVKEALSEAEQGKFASSEKVQAVFAKYGVKIES